MLEEKSRSNGNEEISLSLSINKYNFIPEMTSNALAPALTLSIYTIKSKHI